MKYLFILISLSVFLFSCKKEKPYNPDDNITYAHWYQLKSNSVDTLFSVYIPNAFTPNEDGINDKFSVLGKDILDSKLIIFDKYNNVIFIKDFMQLDNIRWNGKENNIVTNELEPMGTYAYKFIVRPSNSYNSHSTSGREYEYTGNVMLVY